MMTTMFIIKRDGEIGPVEFCVKTKEFERIKPDEFLSVNEIVQEILDNTSQKELLEIRDMNKNDLILLHHNFGRWIRNSYGLWLEQNPLIQVNAEPDSLQHPDNLSFDIIEKVYARLTSYESFDSAKTVMGDN